MKNKIWHKIIIATETKNINIYPTEEFDGIIVEINTLDNKVNSKLYLNEDEMDLLIIKMREMMQYVKQ
jgi:hypothetical protein